MVIAYPVIEWFRGYQFSFFDVVLVGIGILLLSLNVMVQMLGNTLEEFKNIYDYERKET